jgi:aspartate aminotransferase-like enzyme
VAYFPRRKLVMLPGPTNVPDRVTDAMVKAIINHRGESFHPLMKNIVSNAKAVFGTVSDMAVLSCSGTGGVEAAVANVVRRGDNVLVPVFGEFSQRLADSIDQMGGHSVRVITPPGDAPRPDLLEDAAKREGKLKAVFVVYNDTSPGTTYRWMKEAADIAKGFGAVCVCDAVSILGGDELPQDKWGIDMVVTASQKCLAAPPGLALISFNDKVKKLLASSPPSTTYFNLAKYAEFGAKAETPFTPALPLFYALDEALKMVLEEGMERRIARHRATASAFYESLSGVGLQPFVKPHVRSNVVVSIKYLEGLDDKSFRECLENDFDVIVAGGFGELKGKIFRVGNMGEVNRSNVMTTVGAIGGALNMTGYHVDISLMLKAAEKKLAALPA